MNTTLKGTLTVIISLILAIGIFGTVSSVKAADCPATLRCNIPTVTPVPCTLTNRGLCIPVVTTTPTPGCDYLGCFGPQTPIVPPTKVDCTLTNRGLCIPVTGPDNVENENLGY